MYDINFMFTMKEPDNENSYTYFVAMYYDSDLNSWLSVDPMTDKYPSLSPYMYCAGNPVVIEDHDGRFPIDIHKELVNNAISNKPYYSQGRERLLKGAGFIADFKYMNNSLVHMDNMSNFSDIVNVYNNAFTEFSAMAEKGNWTGAGLALHTVADFYAHSNYIELYKQYAKKNNLSDDINDIPTFSEAQKDEKLMSYLKDNGLKTGTYGSGPFEYIKDSYTNDPNAHGRLNKDKNDTYAGSKKYNNNGTITMHEAAKRVAQKELNNIVDK